MAQPTKTTACRILDGLGIAYTLHAYDWDEQALDAATVAAKLGLDPQRVFKTLVGRGDRSGLLLAVIPGDRQLDDRALARLSGDKRVDLVPVRELPALTGYVRGGVSPLGVRRRARAFVDATALSVGTISVSAGRRGLQMFLDGGDLVRALGATVAPLTR
jgi:Cys-tRNA(Pro)/Cys-tRNA(Cys) deacylase